MKKISSSIRGQRKFTGPKAVEVKLNAGGTRTLTADTIFINTGGSAGTTRITGLRSVKALDSTSIMELQELPQHLLVLGGGYVGLEFGEMFRRFGSAVTIVQHGTQLLGREDQDVADEVLKGRPLADGIEILLETEAVAVHASGSGVGLDVRSSGGQAPSPALTCFSRPAERPIASSSTLRPLVLTCAASSPLTTACRPASPVSSRAGRRQRWPGVHAHLL